MMLLFEVDFTILGWNRKMKIAGYVLKIQDDIFW